MSRRISLPRRFRRWPGAALLGATAMVAPASPAIAQENGHPHDHATNEVRGPVVSGVPTFDVEVVTWVGDEENLTYSNPFGQAIGPVWVDDRMGWAIHGGEVWIDPDRTEWANQYMPVYSLEGGPDGGPERVPGQHIIYDTAPGDEGYSPICRHTWVVVPRDYEPNSLRSLDDITRSGYRTVLTDRYFN